MSGCHRLKKLPVTGSHEAAKRSALLYSLIGTYKLHGIEPACMVKKYTRKNPRSSTHANCKINSNKYYQQDVEGWWLAASGWQSYNVSLTSTPFRYCAL
jgi:hypothetical protein